MARPYEVSVLRSRFSLCSCCWTVRVAGTDRPILVGNYPVEHYPLAAADKGYVFAYGPLDDPGGVVPITRLPGNRYANSGGTFVMMASRRQKPGMVRFRDLLPDLIGGSSIQSIGLIDMGQPEGWVWPAGYSMDTALDLQEVTVSAGGQTDTAYVSRKCGNTIATWRTQGATYDVTWIAWQRPLFTGSPDSRVDVGLNMQLSEFLVESTSLGSLLHNPTQFGNDTYNFALAQPYSDEFITMNSPTIEKFIKSSEDSDAFFGGSTIPIEFEKGERFSLIPGHLDQFHGGSNYVCTVYDDMLHTQWCEMNWRGRTGVHRFSYHSHCKFDIANLTADVLTAASFPNEDFDELVWFDPATGVATSQAWDHVAEPSVDWEVGVLRRLVKTNKLTSAVTLGATPFTTLATAALFRATGSRFGTPNDLCVGYYAILYENPSGPSARSMTVTMDRQSADSVKYVAFNLGIPSPFAGLRRAGYIPGRYFLVTGTYAEVQARIRQLYLDGHGSSVWNL